MITAMHDHDAKMLEAHQAITNSYIGGPDLYARTEFTCGLCATFAASLHDRTGWNIYAEYERNGDIVHVWCINEDGKAVDINGTHISSWAKTPFSESTPFAIKPLLRSECNSISQNAVDDFRWANEIIDDYPELYGCSKLTSPRL